MGYANLHKVMFQRILTVFRVVQISGKNLDVFIWQFVKILVLMSIYHLVRKEVKIYLFQTQKGP